MPRRKKEQPRREKGEGGLYLRGDGRWVASLDLPPEFPGGPRRRKVFYGATRDEARDKRMEWAVGKKGTLTAPVKGTLGEFLEYWLANVKLNLVFNSRRVYRAALNHLKPLYHIQLEKLTNEQIQTHIAKLTRSKGAFVARRALSKLHQALTYAVKTKRIRVNEAAVVEAPQHTPRKPQPFATEQALRFIEIVTGHIYEMAFWLSLCGLRTGEVRAARWGDVDWENSTIRVERQAKREKGPEITGKTKTESSVRTVYLPPQAMAALTRAREAWRGTALARSPETRDLIVISKHGRILPATTYSSAYAAVLKRAGIPHRALHNLRHTFATLATNNGAAPPAVQAQLGHKRPDMTFAYTHPTPEGQSRAAAAYGDAIKKKRVE